MQLRNSHIKIQLDSYFKLWIQLQVQMDLYQQDSIYPEEQAQENLSHHEDYYDYQDDYYGHQFAEQQTRIICLPQILEEVLSLNEKTAIYTNLSLPWNLMLLQACGFSEQKLTTFIDQSKNYLHLINYNSEYTPTLCIGTCTLCNTTTQVYANSCRHSACFNCLRSYMQQSDVEMQKRELFPKCYSKSCSQKVNNLLINLLVTYSDQLKVSLNQILIMKYLQKCSHLIACRGYYCGKIIKISAYAQNSVVCDCGTRMCTRCKQLDHFPNQCQHVKQANNIFYSPQPFQNIYSEQLHCHCADCDQDLLIGKNPKLKSIKCVCGQTFCWQCFKLHFAQREFEFYEGENVFLSAQTGLEWLEQDMQISHKIQEVQFYRARIRYLYSNRIELLASQVPNMNPMYGLSYDLIGIRNTVADIYRFLVNYIIYKHYNRNYILISQLQMGYLKEWAEKLYRAVLRPQIKEQDIIEDLIMGNKTDTINLKSAEIKQYYEKLRQLGN